MNKLCPLRKVIVPVAKPTLIQGVTVTMEETVLGECYGDQCAWWDSGKCSILSIANILEYRL